MIRRARLAAICLAAAALANCTATGTGRAPSAASASAEADVRAAAGAFVASFNALDQARFDALWADDATVFFPQAPFPIRRVEGKTDVVLWFKRFMDSQRERGASPGVDPQNLDVQLLGPSGALVSFHLGTDAERAARRTLVYRREPGGWRIVHLHGSALSNAKP